MRYGVCGGADVVTAAAEAGYDYFEMTVGDLLRPLADEAEFEEGLPAARAAPLPCEAVNCFVPGHLKITGPEANPAVLEEYVTIACRRAQTAGVHVIVFGSSGARNIPDGFDRDEADRQLLAFCRMAGPIASGNSVTIVVEPLNAAESNVLTTVADAAELVRKTDHPGVQLLVDGYHWAKDNDSADDVIANGNLLKHAHIATVANRLAPGAEECDFSAFFQALSRAGYDGRISVEGGIPNPSEDLQKALALMKELAGDGL